MPMTPAQLKALRMAAVERQQQAHIDTKRNAATAALREAEGRENLRAVIDDARRSYAARAAQGHTMRPGCPVCQNRRAL